jgi:hypothetical protein
MASASAAENSGSKILYVGSIIGITFSRNEYTPGGWDARAEEGTGGEKRPSTCPEGFPFTARLLIADISDDVAFRSDPEPPS